jgi:hypothetical protein
MIGLSSRRYGRAILVAVLCASLATGGCVTTGDGDANLTPEQQQLRAQKQRWNETMISGAAVGAAVGAAGGLAVGLASGSKNAGLIALTAGLVGAAIGAGVGALVADRNLEFEKREMNANERLAAAQRATQNLESRAATSEALARTDRAKLDQLDAQYRANTITAAQYRTESASIKNDLALIKESAEDAKKAREKINTVGTQAPVVLAEEPKMGAAQRRLEESANQIEEKLNRIPST